MRRWYGILDFYREAQQRDFARANTFRVKSINGVFRGNDDTLLIYATGGAIPSRSIKTATVPFKAFNFNIPMNAEYPEAAGSYSLEFYCDKEYRLREILEQWSRNTFNEQDFTGKKNPLTTDLEIALLSLNFMRQDLEFKEQRIYTLKGAFPAQIGPMQYDNTKDGQIVKCTVTVGFQYVKVESSPQGVIPMSPR